MTDSKGPGKLVRHMQNPSYTYDTYLICMGLGPEAYCPSQTKVSLTVVRHIQVHLYTVSSALSGPETFKYKGMLV